MSFLLHPGHCWNWYFLCIVCKYHNIIDQLEMSEKRTGKHTANVSFVDYVIVSVACSIGKCHPHRTQNTEHKIYKRFSFSFSLILVNLIHGVCVVCQTESTTSAISETFRLFDLIGWINKIHYINKLYLCGNLKGDYMLHSTTAA